jgi:hypothetical protein
VCVCEFESACVCVCTKRAPVENSNNNDEITTCVGDFIFRGETGADGRPRRVVIGGQFTSHTRVLVFHVRSVVCATGSSSSSSSSARWRAGAVCIHRHRWMPSLLDACGSKNVVVSGGHRLRSIK